MILYIPTFCVNSDPFIDMGASLKVRFDEISAEGTSLTITDEAWFPDQELERRGKVSAAVLLKRDGQRVFVDGTLSATVILACDRCLELFEKTLGDDFQVEFEFTGSAPSISGEHEIDADEMDTIFIEEAAIDIFQLLRQQVFLALPERLLCADECQGLCRACGANHNKEACRCGAKENVSPFSVLAGLKTIKK